MGEHSVLFLTIIFFTTIIIFGMLLVVLRILFYDIISIELPYWLIFAAILFCGIGLKIGFIAAEKILSKRNSQKRRLVFSPLR